MDRRRRINMRGMRKKERRAASSRKKIDLPTVVSSGASPTSASASAQLTCTKTPNRLKLADSA